MKKLTPLLALALCSALLLPAASAEAGPKKAKKGIAVTWLGHATFEITSPGGTTLLIDPFLVHNPKTPKARKKLAAYTPDAILVSHSHQDHTADALAIARKSGAKVIGAAEHIRSLELPDDQKLAGNVGGRLKVGDIEVNLVPAMHGSSPGGRPLGFVLRFQDGRSIYFTGDTWIFGDMALIQELFHPQIILLQAGGGPYNQNPQVAKLAVEKYFEPEVIVPMHYGTWPVLADEAAVKQAFAGDARVRQLKPGVTTTF